MILLLFTYLITYLYTILLTYLLTPSNTILLEKLAGSKLVKNFPTIYWTRMFISGFKSARHLSLTWVISIQDMRLHPTSWKSILKTFSHLSLGLPSGNFPSVFPTKILYTTLQSTNRLHAPTHMLSHSSKDNIFSKSLLITTNSFITILIDCYNERLHLILRQLLLTFCVSSQRRPLLIHTITDLYDNWVTYDDC